MYVNDLKKGIADGHITPQILKESPATAHVDGRNGLGPVVGKFCMDLAIKVNALPTTFLWRRFVFIFFDKL